MVAEREAARFPGMPLIVVPEPRRALGRMAGRYRSDFRIPVIAVAGTTYRVVSLRPATRARFSTNYFHDTWHIVTGCAGAAVLGRLLWGLAFQRQPGTLIVIDAPHLVTTPFEGDRPDPIVLVPAGLTRFDAEHLRRVLVNLLDNAQRHASAAPAAIGVRLAVRDESSVLLRVDSDGPPIAHEIEPYLFEPFFSTRSRGSGLGLYICRELCERYGASIEYRLRPDGRRNLFLVVMRREGAHSPSQPDTDRSPSQPSA